MTEVIWRKPRVLSTIGMGNTWLYSEIAEGRFPRPIKLGARAVGWKESDVLEWLASRQISGGQ